MTVPSPPGWALAALSLGALLVILWRGPFRWAGLAPIAVAGLAWTQVERPQILVADNGGLVGILTEDGRALSRARGSGFVAQVWLENDGSAADQESAAALWQTGLPVAHVTGRRRAEALTGCDGAAILVANAPVGALSGGCRVFDSRALRDSGAVAITLAPDGSTKIVTAREVTGARFWNTPGLWSGSGFAERVMALWKDRPRIAGRERRAPTESAARADARP